MNVSSANPAPAPLPAPAPRRRFRWLVRSLLGLVIVVAALVAALPSMLSWFPSLRDMAIRQAAGDMNGDVTVGSLSVGWFEPLSITKVVVTPRQGSRAKPWQPAVSIERLESERGLWAMLTAPEDLGTFRIERPAVFVEIDQGHVNFATLFPKPAATPSEPKPTPSVPEIGARVRIVDGSFRYETDGSDPWGLTGINLGAGMTAASVSKSGRPEIVVDRGTLISRQAITVGMCDDLLKFVAPVVARATRVQGEISIELDDWRLPLGDIGTGEMGGRVTMHSVEAGPGPMTSEIHRVVTSLPIIANWKRELALPKFITIAQDSTVPFKMLPGGRIHHENLKFNVAGLISVGTHGTVGIDESLDLTAEFGLHPPNPEERYLALLRQLATTPLPLNIRGTLRAPVIDAKPIAQSLVKMAVTSIPEDWASGRPSLGADTMRRLQALGIPVEPADVSRIAALVESLKAPQTPAAPGNTGDPNTGDPNTGDLNTGDLNAAGGSAAAPAAPAQPIDGAKIALDIVGELLRRRAQMQAQRQQQNGPYPGGPFAPNSGVPNQVGPNQPRPMQPVPGGQNGSQAFGPQPYGPDVPPLVAPGSAGATNPSLGGPPPAQQPGFAQQPPPGQPPPAGLFPRRPLLRKGLGLLRDTIEQATQPPPPAAVPAPSPMPGTVTPGTVTPGTVTPGTATPSAPRASPSSTPSSTPRQF